MSFRKSYSIFFFSLFIFLSSCSNSSDEFDTYFNDLYPEIEKEVTQAEKLTEKYMKLILDSKPKESIEFLNQQVIPQHEALLEKFEKVDLTESDLVQFNKLSEEIAQINLDQRLYSKNLFEDIISAQKEDNLTGFDIDDAVEGMHELNEHYLAKLNEQVDAAEELTEKYESLKFDEINSISVDVNTLNEAYNELIENFIDHIDNFS